MKPEIKEIDGLMFIEISFVREFSTHEGFSSRYYENLKNFKSPSRAYEKTEEQHEEIFGRRHYSSYDSFRTAHVRVLKK